jgi:anti-sigma factor RsiW
MTHVTAELTALIDGALDEASRARVEAHLAGCGACRAEQARLDATLATLRALPTAPEPSPLFETRLAARLARERRPGLIGRLGAWRWRLAWPTAGLAAATLAGVLVIRHQRADELAMADQLELLENYEVAASLDAVETADDAALVAHLDTFDRAGVKP